jgi:murein DD-endopeptidase MepM/ murein hydrolase activator NlpD
MSTRTQPPAVIRLARDAFQSVGEILFLRRWTLGAVIWSVLALASPMSCLTGTLALFAALGIDFLFRTQLPERVRSIGALNAFLLGLGFAFIRGPLATLPDFLILAGVILVHQVLFYALHALIAQRLQLPILTISFVVILTVLMAFTPGTATPSGRAATISFVNSAEDALASGLPASVSAFFRSLGALFFTRSILFGLAIAASLLIYSRILFSLAVVAFILVTPVRILLPSDAVFELVAFNCMVTVMMIAAVLEVPSRWSYRNAALFGLLTLVLAFAWSTLSVPMLNIPFLLAVPAYVLTRPALRQLGVLALDFAPGTPEQNLYYAVNRRDRYAGIAGAPFVLPFNGTWVVTQAHDGRLTHKDAWRHAWDFEMDDADGNFSRNGSVQLLDFYAYRQPVCASLDGEVVNLQGLVADNPPGQFNFGQNWGNTVVLRHAGGICTAYSHLSSIAPGIFPGKWVRQGELLGHCGNSGRSERPHLHFQFQATARIGEQTLSLPFKRYIVPGPAGNDVRTSAFPGEGEHVSNIGISPRLLEAFSFPYGRTLTATGEMSGRVRTEHWLSTVDFYNHTYLYCQETGAAAYFFIDDGVFYFTDYFGPRSSFLNAFALAASRVVCVEQRGLVYADRLPLNRVQRTMSNIFADVLSPIVSVKELRTHYRLELDTDRSIRLETRTVAEGMVLRKRTLAEFRMTFPYGTGSIRLDGTLLQIPSSFIIS